MSFAEFLELMADIMSQTTRWGNLGTKLSGYVGFDTIQEQIRKKSLKRGFELNLMVVGKLVTAGTMSSIYIHVVGNELVLNEAPVLRQLR